MAALPLGVGTDMGTKRLHHKCHKCYIATARTRQQQFLDHHLTTVADVGGRYIGETRQDSPTLHLYTHRKNCTGLELSRSPNIWICLTVCQYMGGTRTYSVRYTVVCDQRCAVTCKMHVVDAKSEPERISSRATRGRLPRRSRKVNSRNRRPEAWLYMV